MDTLSRSHLFTSLSRYHAAGMTFDAALDAWRREDTRWHKSAGRTAALVKGGMTLDQAGVVGKLFKPWEARLIRLGNQHGRLDLTLNDLSRHYAKSSRWWRTLRGRLVLPVAVLILGLIVLPLPGLIAGRLGVSVYLGMVSLVLVAAWLGWKQFARVSGYPAFLDQLPAQGRVGDLLSRYHRSQFIGVLALLYEAGIPVIQAVEEALGICRSVRLRKQWQPVIADLNRGKTLAEGLRQVGIVDADGYALLSTGEASGSLIDMLKRERDRLEEALELDLQIIGEWLPRVVYVSVVVGLLGVFT